MRRMSFHFSHLWCEKKKCLPENYLFSQVLSVPVNLRPTSGKKTGKQQGCRCGPEYKPVTPLLPKEHSLQTCSYPSHFLNSCGDFLCRLICCWLLECGVTSSVTCGDSGARPWWVHRKHPLMRPLPSPSQLKCYGLLQGRFRWVSCQQSYATERNHSN